MLVKILDQTLRAAAEEGMDAFIEVVVSAIKDAVGGELTAESMQQLTSDQITLWGYSILHEELMDGGFIQLIYNGYGPFFFDNPFAKAMRLWGLHDFSKLLYKAKKIYDLKKDELVAPCSDEDFMARFEQYPEFDELDDNFIENEEDITSMVARYIDEHLEELVEIEDDKNSES